MPGTNNIGTPFIVYWRSFELLLQLGRASLTHTQMRLIRFLFCLPSTYLYICACVDLSLRLLLMITGLHLVVSILAHHLIVRGWLLAQIQVREVKVNACFFFSVFVLSVSRISFFDACLGFHREKTFRPPDPLERCMHIIYIYIYLTVASPHVLTSCCLCDPGCDVFYIPT